MLPCSGWEVAHFRWAVFVACFWDGPLWVRSAASHLFRDRERKESEHTPRGSCFFLSFLSQRLNATERGEGREAVDGIDGELGTRDTGGYSFFFPFSGLYAHFSCPTARGRPGVGSLPFCICNRRKLKIETTLRVEARQRGDCGKR